LRHSRNIGALRETHREVDQEQNSPAAAQGQAPEQNAGQSGPVRTWSHRGGMVPQQESANTWIRQDNDIRMAQSGRAGGERSGEGAQSSSQHENSNLQQARAAAEEARRRQEAQRQREAERVQERGGPER
jgi:hypothetical protein